MPQSNTKVCVFDDLLHPRFVEEAYEILQVHRIRANTIYFPIEYFGHEERVLTGLSARVAHPAGTLLATYCNVLYRSVSGVFGNQWDGLEIWTNCSKKCGPDVWLHLDSDEKHRKETGEVKHPLFGSVLHLGPVRGLRGGETFFCLDADDPRLDKLTFRDLPWRVVTAFIAGAGMSVPFRAGRTILFDGRLAHCIAPFTLDDEQKPRLSLLVNGWSTRIRLD